MLQMPNSVRKSIMLRPPSSTGPWRIAVGVVFEAPNFWSAAVIMDDWTAAKFSSSAATAGSEYNMDGAYIVRRNAFVCSGDKRDDFSRDAI